MNYGKYVPHRSSILCTDQVQAKIAQINMNTFFDMQLYLNCIDIDLLDQFMQCLKLKLKLFTNGSLPSTQCKSKKFKTIFCKKQLHSN